MKKLFYFAAAAVALAACAKNEVIPVNSGENQEITFNVAPKTKADPEPAPDPEPKKEAFSTNNVFASWAYYLPGTVKWDKKDGDNTTVPSTPATTPALYIDGAEISNTKPDGTDGVWKAKNTYYWPKNGSLTFFAYSLNKGDLHLTGGDSHLGCDVSTGIAGAIDLNVNPNTDFLVAEIAKDQTSNVQTHFTNGVPTLFKHRLSSVAFAIKTGADYTNKQFKLTNITFHNLSHYGNYRQLTTESFLASGTKYNPVFTSTPQDMTTDFVGVTRVDKYIFIPQTFADDATIDVVYTITTKVPKSDAVVETVTKTIKLNELFPTKYDDSEPRKVIGGGWEMGKKYTIKLTFTLDEILWDPAVQDWEGVNIGTDTKPIIVG